MYCVSEVTDTHFNRGDNFLYLSTGQFELAFFETDINSIVGRSAVPATQEEIAEFKAAELRSEIKVGQTYRVEMPASDNSVFELTITGKDAKNFNVTYEGISGKNVSDTISQDSAIWKDAELVE